MIPEFTCDVGTKKGEKVDYAIFQDGGIRILVECKPASAALNINHAGQLFLYFSVTDARLAILTNGLVYQFYSDIEQPNKMDQKPFFSLNIESLKNSDARIVEKFIKSFFDIDSIVQEAGSLKTQSQLRAEIEKEIENPSEEFVTMFARRIHDGKLTAAVKENFTHHVSVALQAVIRERVTDRLSSALKVSEPTPIDTVVDQPTDKIITTEEELTGFRIVQAISAQSVSPKRIPLRDAKSYAAILLDDNNRKPLARLYFNAASVKYVSTFSGKIEERHQINDVTDIFDFTDKIHERIKELEV